MATISSSLIHPQTLMSIRNMELRARVVVEGFWTGLHRSPYHGFSVEFTEYRQYTPGDDTRYLDWRPFSYCTLERVSTKGSLTAAPPMLETMELAALADGRTELRYRMQARTRAGRLKLKLFGPMVRRSFEKELLLLERVLREDGITTVGSAQSPPPVPSVSPK